MNTFPELPTDKRRATVEESAARLGILPVIVEKDYWVCWLLGRIFEQEEWARNIVFKGGTTLSKVFGVIERFSEDIDLSVSPKILGVEESTLENAPSKGKREKLFESMQIACGKFIAGRFQPEIEKAARTTLGARRRAGAWFEYRYDFRTDSPVLLFQYPSSLEREHEYIEPVVKLEFGSLTDQQPAGTHYVRPLLADVIPTFKDITEQVVALEVERTFWEKATILHAEYHRPADKPIPDRFARHYSDFAALWEHSAKTAAIKRLDLLKKVASFKSRFFASRWANYQTAVPGTLKLSPPNGRKKALEHDYSRMTQMFLKTPPPFADVLKVLDEAQAEINST